MAKKLTNGEAWTRATNEVRAKTAVNAVGPVDDGARLVDLPADDASFWDAVEKRAVELGGRPAS